MTWSAVLLVTAVVWAVSVIRSVRLRALVYSLPLPMTLALLSTDYRVGGAQLLGVLGLNLFFVTVAVTYHRLRWPILLADAAGIAVYVALSAGLLAVVVPFEAALVGTLVLWSGAMLLLHRRARPSAAPADAPAAPADERAAVAETSDGGRPDGLPALLKLVVIFVGAILTALLGAVLRGMVVTFPYSGVLVAVEARHQLREFSRHFARNSLALVGFLTAYHYLQDASSAVALGAGWAAFAVVAVALHLPLRPRPAAPDPSTAGPTIASPPHQQLPDRRPATPPADEATPGESARRRDPATLTGGGPAVARRAAQVRPPRPLRPATEPPSVR
ncbi:hypothetical protein [Micromonospora sp. DH14]|uniref:hypothetical protein n=1 Tax=Micromonospora sp. DH14 TaxID=3040120 RepID=UPI002443148C|nr:hypothetical protein [Micromonospora sp. DH14]MDG9677243.1 hypothetical protein [Micromonospora sp. DH14]